MPPPTGSRSCRRCRRVKPNREFQPLRGSRLNATCRPCLNHDRHSAAPVDPSPTSTSDPTSPTSAPDTSNAHLSQAEPFIPTVVQPDPFQICTRCNRIKTSSDFRPSGSRRAGHCRSCRGGSSSIAPPRPDHDQWLMRAQSGGQPQQNSASNPSDDQDAMHSTVDSPRWAEIRYDPNFVERLQGCGLMRRFLEHPIRL